MTPLGKFRIGDLVKVVREYDHRVHTDCYKGRQGHVIGGNVRSIEVRFQRTQSPRPDLAIDTRHFPPSCLKIVGGMFDG